MAWIWLLIAGLCEIGWAIGLKYTQGFSKPLASIITVIVMIASFFFLAQAVKQLPLGQSYAIWTGIGIIGTTILGAFLFKESLSLVQICCIAMIVAGIIGLRLSH